MSSSGAMSRTPAAQPGSQEGDKPGKPRLRDRPWWPWARRIATLVFFVLVAMLLWRYGRNVKWDEVFEALAELPRPALLIAIALGATSHLLYSCFDLLGRHYTGHSLKTATVMTINFISYAFNLSLGSLVGGVAFRYRLYSRKGLENGVITRVVTMSMVTNWLGYMLLGGLLFIFTPLELPPGWGMGNHGLQWIGGLLVALSVAYVLACLWMGGLKWTVRGHEIHLPPVRMAFVQLAISCLNWSVMAAVVYVLLQQKVVYTDVLTVLLVAAIAGVITHVPGGLGVFEFVFIALLSHQVSEPRILAALLGYRAIYYLAPLVIALVMYLVFEIRARRQVPGAVPDRTPDRSRPAS